MKTGYNKWIIKASGPDWNENLTIEIPDMVTIFGVLAHVQQFLVKHDKKDCMSVQIKLSTPLTKGMKIAKLITGDK